MNVLITSAGRRTSLVNIFLQATKSYGGQVMGADIDPLAPALFLVDQSFKVPRAGSSQYISELLNIVEAYKIKLLVPTIDTELLILSEAQAQFAALGCRVHISDSNFVKTTGDKWLTAQEFAQRGVRVPASWLPEELPELGLLPEHLFLKPRDGSASIHTYSTHKNELLEVLKRVPNAIIQEKIADEEITIDAFISQAGIPIHFVPRERIKTLGGESIQGRTLAMENQLVEFLETALIVASELGARGAVTLQAFKRSDGYVLLEINPRFGGGYPLGHAAGGLYPEWLLQEISGQSIQPRFGEYQVGLYMTRANTEIYTTQPKW